MKIAIFASLLLIPHALVRAQNPADSSEQRLLDATGYSWITQNKTKHSFWGNSTLVSTSVNFSKQKEFGISIGRSRGLLRHSGNGMGESRLYSWGLGYSYDPGGSQRTHSLRAFYEYDYCPFLFIGNFGVRGEYLYNFTTRQSYLRPGIGLSLLVFDVLYNYSFLLQGEKQENLYRHGLSLRIKFFLFKKNWERKTLRITDSYY